MASYLFPREFGSLASVAFSAQRRFVRSVLDYRAVYNASQQSRSSGFLARAPVDPVSASVTDTVHKPPEPIDFGLFEASTDEYARSQDVRALKIAPRPSLRALIVEALELGQVDKAEQLCDEMHVANLPIEPHLAFETRALEQLGEDKLDQFLKWWSLAPPLDASDPPERISRVHDAAQYLITQPQALATTAKFIVMAAEKGFAHIVGRLLLSYFVRVAIPRAVEGCWSDFADAAARADSDDGGGRERTVALLIELRNVLLRGHVIARRSDLAVDILERFRRYPPPSTDAARPLVETLTYKIFLENLSRRGETALYRRVETSAKEDFPELSFDDPRSWSSDWGYPAAESNVRQALAEGEFDVDFEELLSKMSRGSGYYALPTVGTIADILGRLYRDGLEARASTFRERFFYALKEKRPLALQHWWTSVMVTQRRAGDLRGCLLTFVEHFNTRALSSHARSLLPVPRATSALKERLLRKRISESHDFIVWPGSYAMAIAYDVLAQLTSSIGELDALYAGFLSSATAEGEEREVTWRGENAAAPRLHTQTAYNAFVTAYNRFELPWRALDVLIDMKRNGLEPNDFNWTVVAGSFAMHDDASIALEILQRMHDQSQPAGRDDFLSQFRLPRGDIVTYANVMSALQIRGMQDDALGVAQLAVSAFGQKALDDPVISSTMRQQLARREEWRGTM
jgi:hypothetical protein